MCANVSVQLQSEHFVNITTSSKLTGTLRNLITSFKICGESIEINVIVKYCTQLQKLYLFSGMVNCELLKPLLGQLSELHLSNCMLLRNTCTAFEGCTNLKVIELYSLQFEFQSDFLVKMFPKLQNLSIRNTDIFGTFERLLVANLQLKTLETTSDPDDRLISIIAENLTELEELNELTIHTRFAAAWRTQEAQTFGYLSDSTTKHIELTF